MKFENDLYYNCEITLDNGEKYLINANSLHNNNIDYWKDWDCSAGHERLLVEPNLDVYGSYCLNDYLGNLNTEWNILDKPTKCKLDRCVNCTDDLLIKKNK